MTGIDLVNKARTVSLYGMTLCIICFLLVAYSGPAQAVVNLSTKEIKEMVKQLGDNKWAVRENATKKLIEAIEDGNQTTWQTAADQVRYATKSADLEVAWRAEKILTTALPTKFTTLAQLKVQLDASKTVLDQAFSRLVDEFIAAVSRGTPAEVQEKLAHLVTVNALRVELTSIAYSKNNSYKQFYTFGKITRLRKNIDSLKVNVEKAGEALKKEDRTNLTAALKLVQDILSKDKDEDGIPSIWEQLFGLDPEDKTDKNKDPDGDGRDNLKEYKDETFPNTKD